MLCAGYQMNTIKLLETNEFFDISNDEIAISPKDKERVELIHEIEKSK